jgi:hypothetical protein
MKKIVMTLAFVMFAGLFMSSAAEARCWWNGYRTVCTHRHYWSGHYYPYRYYRAYPPYYYGYGYYPYYYRPVCTPWPLCWG